MPKHTSALDTISAIVDTACDGNAPFADSPLSMTASTPSYTAFATSVISALVGRGFEIMDSSICVAQMTNLPAMLHLVTIIFCARGTCTASVHEDQPVHSSLQEARHAAGTWAGQTLSSGVRTFSLGISMPACSTKDFVKMTRLHPWHAHQSRLHTSNAQTLFSAVHFRWQGGRTKISARNHHTVCGFQNFCIHTVAVASLCASSIGTQQICANSCTAAHRRSALSLLRSQSC